MNMEKVREFFEFWFLGDKLYFELHATISNPLVWEKEYSLAYEMYKKM